MTTISNPRVEEIRHRLHSSYQDVQDFIEKRLRTLDSAMLYRAPTEGEWTLMQSLAHIAEFMTYWADEIAKLVAAPGRDFGRVMSDPHRIKTIEDHRHDTLAQAQAAITPSYAHLDQILSSLKDSDLDISGRHSRFGERTLDWFIKEFVTDHLANHVQQMRECLALLEANTSSQTQEKS